MAGTSSAPRASQSPELAEAWQCMQQMGSSSASPVDKLTATYKLLLLCQTQSPGWLLNLGSLMGTIPGVLKFVMSYSTSSEPLGVIPLQLLTCLATASPRVAAQLVEDPEFLDSLLGVLRASRGDVLLSQHIVMLLYGLSLEGSTARAVAQHLGEQFALVGVLCEWVSCPAKYRHLRLPALHLLSCLMLCAEGQAALWRRNSAVGSALRAALAEP
eukprot:RCo039044